MERGGFPAVYDAKGKLVLREKRFIPHSQAEAYESAWREVHCRVRWRRPKGLDPRYDRIAHLLLRNR